MAARTGVFHVRVTFPHLSPEYLQVEAGQSAAQALAPRLLQLRRNWQKHVVFMGNIGLVLRWAEDIAACRTEDLIVEKVELAETLTCLVPGMLLTDKTEAQELLANHLTRNGTFLVRPSLTLGTDYVVAVVTEGRILNYKVSIDEDEDHHCQFSVASKKFPSLKELVEYYGKHPLRTRGSSDACMLTIPIVKQDYQQYLSQRTPLDDDTEPESTALPPGWSHQVDDATQTEYYFNAATGEICQSLEGTSGATTLASLKIVYQWREVVDDTDRQYFIDVVNDAAQWSRPADFPGAVLTLHEGQLIQVAKSSAEYLKKIEGLKFRSQQRHPTGETAPPSGLYENVLQLQPVSASGVTAPPVLQRESHARYENITFFSPPSTASETSDPAPPVPPRVPKSVPTSAAPAVSTSAPVSASASVSASIPVSTSLPVSTSAPTAASTATKPLYTTVLPRHLRGTAQDSATSPDPFTQDDSLSTLLSNKLSLQPPSDSPPVPAKKPATRETGSETKAQTLPARLPASAILLPQLGPEGFPVLRKVEVLSKTPTVESEQAARPSSVSPTVASPTAAKPGAEDRALDFSALPPVHPDFLLALDEQFFSDTPPAEPRSPPPTTPVPTTPIPTTPLPTAPVSTTPTPSASVPASSAPIPHPPVAEPVLPVPPPIRISSGSDSRPSLKNFGIDAGSSWPLSFSALFDNMSSLSLRFFVIRILPFARRRNVERAKEPVESVSAVQGKDQQWSTVRRDYAHSGVSPPPPPQPERFRVRL
eukprot:m.550295 g.550295  ORF g.550295 m.550295 type:complete len:764 (+) comp57730_c0_seq18:68-2359(+)